MVFVEIALGLGGHHAMCGAGPLGLQWGGFWSRKLHKSSLQGHKNRHKNGAAKDGKLKNI
jgi:hypothetical protein